MTKKLHIFLLIIMFLCSFTLSSCNTKSFVSSYYDLNGKLQEFVIENKETYEFRVDEWYYIKLEGASYANSIKIKANEAYFKIKQNEIVPIKECDNEKVVLYSGMNRVVFYVDAVAIDKFIDFIIRGCYEYNEEKVIIHFDYNTPFLDLKAYNINNVVIGDVIRMYYSGTFQCTQADWYNNAYGFDVVNVERTFDAIPYTFIINEDYIPVMVNSEIDYKFHHFVYVQKTYYVIEEDNVCVPIDKLEIGQILYGFACATNPNEIVSLYTYNPKE